jgi:hypothetical protein
MSHKYICHVINSKLFVWSTGWVAVMQYCSISFNDFWGSNKKQRSCDGRGGGGEQRTVWRVNGPKETGARTRDQNPPVAIRIALEDNIFMLTNVNRAVELAMNDQ